MSGSTELAYMEAGLTVPLSAIRLAWALEDRGFQLRSSGERGLIVGPKTKITDEDPVEIRKRKAHIVALVAYQAAHARVA